MTTQGFRCLPAALVDRLQECAIVPRLVPAGTGQGRHRARTHGASVEFADYRRYIPGDPPNRIDWAVYARTDRVLIRRFEDETALRVHVLVDRSESMAFGGTDAATNKLAYASQLAAGLLYVAVQQGDTAHLHTVDTQVTAHGHARSPASLPPLLSVLDGLLASGRSTLAVALQAFAASRPQAGLVVVISDFLEDAAGLTSAVRVLRHAGHRVHLWQVLDRAELQLSMSGADGLLELAELETGRKLLVEVDEFREAYQREAAAHLARLRDACSAASAGYRLCDPAEPIDHSLRTGIRSL